QGLTAMSKAMTRAAKSGAAPIAPAAAAAGPHDSGVMRPGPAAPARDVAHALDFGRVWEYAPSPEATDHVALQRRYDLWIGGQWKKPRAGKYFATFSPSTEEKLAEVAEADARDVDDAVRAARHAYDKYWSKLRGAERAKYIFRIARAIQEKARELAIV